MSNWRAGLYNCWVKMSYRLLSDEQLLADCRVEAFRGPGPGGQKRNKTSSAIRLTHKPTGLSAISTESRSQQRNRQTALARLRHKMALLVREVVNLAEFPEPEILDVSQRAFGYPAAMGKILDLLDHVGWSVSDAAKILGVSTGQLVGFLRADGALFAEMNRQRKDKGLRGLNS
jgi:hypothetical protein